MARRHVLIGAGPGAVAAAQAIRGADDGAEIVIVATDPHGYYSRPGLAYYLAAELPEKRLLPFTRQDFSRLRVSLVHDEVTGIDRAARRVTLAERRRTRLRPPADRHRLAVDPGRGPRRRPGRGHEAG